MQGLDPLVQKEKVLPRIYNEKENKRLVRRLRRGYSYCGVTTIDVIGCNMLCAYCYVATDFLVGKGELLDRELKKGDIQWFTPNELARHVSCSIRKNRWPSRIQMTAAEPFITSKWLIDFIQEIGSFCRTKQSHLWIDTNGIELWHEQSLIKELLPFKDFLRLFISSKNAPGLYTKTSRTDAKYADYSFQALEMLWKHQIFALLQAPMPNLWDPDSFFWYLERLLKIHPAAPLLLEVDNMFWLPVKRISPNLKRAGWKNFQKQNHIRSGWQMILENHYKKKMQRLIEADKFPEDQELLPKLVFENNDILKCHLFKK